MFNALSETARMRKKITVSNHKKNIKNCKETDTIPSVCLSLLFFQKV